MATSSTDPYSVYLVREKGIGVRKVIEMVAALHERGFGRLRLACYWENAGPAPVWFGAIAPVTYFRRDHGALLARNPLPENVELFRRSTNVNDIPMFTDRRFRSTAYPWPGFVCGAPEESAAAWLERYPQLGSEGRGEDPAYVTWYKEMLLATAPTGLLAASHCWYPRPDYMYVSCGPDGVDRVPLPPPGEAEGDQSDAAGDE